MTGYDPWDPWPTDADQLAMVLRTPPLPGVCDCGVTDGTSEATNPDDRSQLLPHHFDCPAVTAWHVLLHDLREPLRETVEAAVNTAYGTDPRHGLLAQHVAAAVLDGTPLPWSLASHFGMWP